MLLLLMLLLSAPCTLTFTWSRFRTLTSTQAKQQPLVFSAFRLFSATADDGDEDAPGDPGLLGIESYSPPLPFSTTTTTPLGPREEDLQQHRDLDLILTERSKRFYDPKLRGVEREACLLVAVETKQQERQYSNSYGGKQGEIRQQFTFQESLSELAELVGTAGLQVHGICIQKLPTSNARTYVGPGKIADIMQTLNATNVRTIVVDDDLTPKQQVSMEQAFDECGGRDVKVLDRTALILEIFAQHASSKEGQVQVELAQLTYRLNRGPRSTEEGKSSGAGFRGPGETKIETDRRVIKDKIILLKRELAALDTRRDQHRKSRARLGLPVVALVGYTNAGKSTLLNTLSRAGVLAENMLFATLDNTIRKVRLDAGVWERGRDKSTDSPTPTPSSPTSSTATANADPPPSASGLEKADELGIIDTTQGSRKGQEVLVTDTVGFISKLPTDLIAAFRATLDEARYADVLVHVCDRASPVWRKQRETVLRELDSLGVTCPIVELWNKVDLLPDPEAVRMEAMCLPVDLGWVREGDVRDVPVEEIGPGGRDVGVSVGDYDSDEEMEGDSLAAAVAVAEGEEEGVEEEGEEESYVTEDVPSSSLAEEGQASIPNANANPLEDDFSYIPEHNALSPAATPELPSSYTYTAPGRGASPNPNQAKTVNRVDRKTFTVAASLKSGAGFDDFVSTLVDALSLRLKEVEVFVPYNRDDGVLAAIHAQGVVLEMSYTNTGTRVVCRVPPSMRSRLSPYRVKKGAAVE